MLVDATLLRYLLAVLLTGMLVVGLRYYPDTGILLPLTLCICTVALYRNPLLMWLYLPASLVLLDFAPATGWYFFEEIDLLLLATAAVGYARLGDCPLRPPPLTMLLRCALALLVVAIVCALIRTVPLMLPEDLMAMNDYLSPYNGWRSAKAWLWMGLYLPMLRRHTARYPAQPERMLQSGLLAGLLLVSYCMLRERWQFPGLLNLSSDYRITAPFSAMHTGGAALDGYLAMCMPVLALWLFQPGRSIQHYAALGLLPVALYGALATFSRGLYLGLGCACLLLVYGLHARPPVPVSQCDRTSLKPRPSAVCIVSAVLLLLVQLQLSFQTAGYRGMLAAALVLFAAALPAPPAAMPRLLGLMLAGLILSAVIVLASARYTTDRAVLKLPYFSLLFSAGVYYLMLARGSRYARFWLGCMAGSSVWICVHHAGNSAFVPACSIIPLGILWTRLPAWRYRKPDGADGIPTPAPWSIVALLMAVTVVPFCNGYFVGERFAHAQDDLRGRWQHWQDVYALMAVQPQGYWLGTGAGRFPALYYWFNLRGETPPHAAFVSAAGVDYLRLQAGSYMQGYGELLNVLQMINIKPDTAYLLSLDVAGGATAGFLQVKICARQLLYPANCSAMPQQSIAAQAAWHRLSTILLSGTLDSADQPVQLQLAAEGNAAVIDVDNVSLIDLATGEQVLRNGTFSQRQNYWFFTSDHHHLPWHIKNLLLNLYFEYGIAGLGGYLILIGATVTRLIARARNPDHRSSAVVWLASVGAFEVVGLFDSLIDVPRILLLHLLILFTVLLSEPALARTYHAQTTS